MVRDLAFWFEWTPLDVWDPVIAEALAHPAAQEATLARSRVLGLAAHRVLYAGRFAEAFALATESVRVARICGDPMTLGAGLFRLGASLIALRREAEALPLLEEGLALTRTLGDSRLEAAFLSTFEDLHALGGRFELAERYGLAAVESNRGVAGQVLATCYCALARDAIGLGSAARATGYLREAAALMGTSDAIRYVQRILVNCPGLAALRSEWLLAMRLAGAAATHRENTGLGLAPDEALPYARVIQPARDALGPSAADAAFASGQAMNVETALSEAVAWLEALPAKDDPGA
jgi:tetratricopeptide (TPR) repeat protein